MFQLVFTPEAAHQLSPMSGQTQHLTKLTKIQKALGHLERDPRHPGLKSHKYQSLKGVNGEDVWDSYVQNHTPSAWRIFWHYGPGGATITILTIGPHR
jgi:hypothetical protein